MMDMDEDDVMGKMEEAVWAVDCHIFVPSPAIIFFSSFCELRTDFFSKKRI